MATSIDTYALSNPDNAATQLRRETRAQHHILDRLPALRALLKSGVTQTQVDHVLQTFAYCFSSLDQGILAGEAELQSLAGCPPYQPRRDWLPASGMPETPLQLRGDAYWGAHYVVEGSTQGSRFILERLENIDHLRGKSLNFWQRQVEAGRHWPVVRSALCRHLVSPDARQNAVTAAQLVMSHFIQAFSVDTAMTEQRT